MASGFLGSIVPAFASYLSPSKSPFAFVSAAGVFSLVLTSQNINEALWLQVAIPIYIVLFMSILMSFRVRTQFELREHLSQLSFSRSLGISAGLLSFVLTARSIDEHIEVFYISYAVCLIQIAVFLLYTYVRTKNEELNDGINYGQFILITTGFLIGASYSLTEYVSYLELFRDDTTLNINFIISGQYYLIAQGLYLLWGICILYWLRQLFKNPLTIDQDQSDDEQISTSWYRRRFFMLIWLLLVPPIWGFFIFTDKRYSTRTRIIAFAFLLPYSSFYIWFTIQFFQ